jgi:flagella basal body P-ring formation protein FlgA
MARIAVLVLALSLAAASRAEAALVTVRLAADSLVRAEEILLEDIARIEGDELWARRLGRLRLGPAPAPGLTQRLDPDYLRIRLREPGLDPQKVRVLAPEEIRVTRAFQLLTGAAVVEAAARAARERLSTLDAGGGPWAVVALAAPPDLRVPVGALDLGVRLQEPTGAPTLLAAMVSARVDGREYRTVPVALRVGRYKSVLVAARALDPGGELSPADLRLEPRLSADLPPGALTAVDNPARLELTRPVKQGEVMTAAALRPRLVIKRGEIVTVMLDGQGFRIRAQGRAESDGRHGEAIRVLNLGSRRDIVARVEGPGVVRVPFVAVGAER